MKRNNVYHVNKLCNKWCVNALSMLVRPRQLCVGLLGCISGQSAKAFTLQSLRVHPAGLPCQACMPCAPCLLTNGKTSMQGGGEPPQEHGAQDPVCALCTASQCRCGVHACKTPRKLCHVTSDAVCTRPAVLCTALQVPHPPNGLRRPSHMEVRLQSARPFTSMNCPLRSLMVRRACM